MILDDDAELDRAEDRVPFSNATDGSAWMSTWCDTCTHNNGYDCPLLGISMLGKTPFSWITLNHSDPRRRYLCADHESTGEQLDEQALRCDRPAPPRVAFRPPPGLEAGGRHRRDQRR